MDKHDLSIIKRHFPEIVNRYEKCLSSSDLNKLLLERFPELVSRYREEVDWQDGDHTGSHIVYGDVFAPYLFGCIEKNMQNEVIRAARFIEELLVLNDIYAREVVAFSVLESVVFLLLDEKRHLLEFFGEEYRGIIKELREKCYA